MEQKQRRVEDYGPFDPIYVFVGNDGEQVVIDTVALYKHVTANPPQVFSTDVRASVAEEIINDNAIQGKRYMEMVKDRVEHGNQYRDPIIYVKTGSVTDGRPDVLLCDGHHRFVVACSFGDTMIDDYVLEPEY